LFIKTVFYLQKTSALKMRLIGYAVVVIASNSTMFDSDYLQLVVRD